MVGRKTLPSLVMITDSSKLSVGRQLLSMRNAPLKVVLLPSQVNHIGVIASEDYVDEVLRF